MRLPWSRSGRWRSIEGFHVWCKACRHSGNADLDALIRSGKGDIPLVRLKWQLRPLQIGPDRLRDDRRALRAEPRRSLQDRFDLWWAETLPQAGRTYLRVMEHDPALDAIFEREQRSRIWRIMAANAAIVIAVTALAACLFPG